MGMYYDSRNRGNLEKLGDHTKIAAYKWYKWLLDNGYNVLIYETIRTQAQQNVNVRNGKSKTYRSYHLVGQALDFVFVDAKGNALWSVSDYTKRMAAIRAAKSVGFTWGGDWDNDGDWRDETFLDSPHLQYNYRGYGTDTFGKVKTLQEDERMASKEYNDLLAKFNSLNEEMNQLKSTKADLKSPHKDVQPSHAEGWKWAKEKGIFNGENPSGALTRQQAATVLKRLTDNQ